METSQNFHDIIHIIKANLSNLDNCNQKYIEIYENLFLNIPPGIYLNLFYKDIASLEFEADHYIDDLPKEKKIEMKNSIQYFNLKNFVNYLTFLTLKSNSRILNINKLAKENQFSEVF